MNGLELRSSQFPGLSLVLSLVQECYPNRTMSGVHLATLEVVHLCTMASFTPYYGLHILHWISYALLFTGFITCLWQSEPC